MGPRIDRIPFEWQPDVWLLMVTIGAGYLVACRRLGPTLAPGEAPNRQGAVNWSRAAAAVAAVVSLTLGPTIGPAQAQAADDNPTATTTTTIEHERADGERGPNLGGAIAGFGLLAAWLLIGFAQLRRGRRRLSARNGTEHSEPGQRATTATQKPQAPADAAAGSRSHGEDDAGPRT